MNYSSTVKYVNVLPPAAIYDNTSPTMGAIDTLGFDRLDVLAIFGATDIAVSTMKLTASNTDSSYVDFAGSLYGATGNPALPTDAADNTIYRWTVELGRSSTPRYFKPAITLGNGAAGTFLTVIAVLSNASEMPSSAAGRGLAAEINLI